MITNNRMCCLQLLTITVDYFQQQCANKDFLNAIIVVLLRMATIFSIGSFSGAAVVFLQLCILTTCLLCLWSSRRTKQRLSRSESVHSSQTGSGTVSPHPHSLHTLYHDQLTYRSEHSSIQINLILIFPSSS